MPLSMNAVPLDSFYYFKDLEDQQQARELELARCSFSENQKKADVKDIRVNDVNEPESALPRDSAEGFIPAEQDVHRPFVESHYFGYLGKYRTEYFLAELEKDQQLGADSDAQTYQEKAKILPEEKRNQDYGASGIGRNRPFLSSYFQQGQTTAPEENGASVLGTTYQQTAPSVAKKEGRNEMSSYAWNNNANNFLQNETISVGHDESSNISHTITESATYKPKVASPVYYSTLLEAKKPVAVEEQYVIPLDSLYFALPNENRPVHLSTLATPREISEPPNESTVDADTAQAAGKAEVGGNLTPHIIKVEEPAPPLQFPAQHYLTQASEVGHAFAPLGSAPDSAYQKEELNDLVLCMDSS